MREKGISEVPVGSIFVSNAGDLLCKKVIHAVGPRWMGGKENEDNDLYDVIYESLAAAEKLKLTSIAIPPVSAGIFGFPLNKCTYTIVEAVNTYFNEVTKTTLTKVYLVSVKQDEVDSFSLSMQAINKHLANKPSYATSSKPKTSKG